MDFSWVFYAVVLFVAGGTCFFIAIAALIKLDETHAQDAAAHPPLATALPSDPPPKLTRLGRPVQQIQIL